MKIHALRLCSKSRLPLSIILLGHGFACSSGDEAPLGARIGHPPQPLPALSMLAPAPAVSMASSPSADAVHSSAQPQTLSEIYEQYTGMELSPRDKAILDDCPDRAWSNHVPKGKCSADDQCGDGFCDRGHCASFWTCRSIFGRPCKSDKHCGESYLCIEGRCRSCSSNAECKDEPDNQNPTCDPERSIPGARSCQGVTGSTEGDIQRGR